MPPRPKHLPDFDDPPVVETVLSVRYLEGSQRRLQELEQAWPKKRLAYQQRLEIEGEKIHKAKRFLGVIDAHREHFRRCWQREDQKRMHERGINGTMSRLTNKSDWLPIQPVTWFTWQKPALCPNDSSLALP